MWNWIDANAASLLGALGILIVGLGLALITTPRIR